MEIRHPHQCEECSGELYGELAAALVASNHCAGTAFAATLKPCSYNYFFNFILQVWWNINFSSSCLSDTWLCVLMPGGYEAAPSMA